MLYSLAGMKANIPSMRTFLTAHLDSCLRYCAGLPDLHLHAESSSPLPSLFSIINFHLSWIWIIIHHHCYCLQIYDYYIIMNHYHIIISNHICISVSRQSRKMISNQTMSVMSQRWNALICHVSNHITIWYAEETYSFSESLYVSWCYCTLHKNTQLRALPLMCRGLLMLLLRAHSGRYHCLRLPWAIFIILIQKAKAILDTAL